MSRDRTIALDVLNAAQLAADFAQGIDVQTFPEDLKTQSAVIHQLLILGEAVKRLSPTFRNEHPELPWKHPVIEHEGTIELCEMPKS